MAKEQRRLGRGLNSLIKTTVDKPQENEASDDSMVVAVGKSAETVRGVSKDAPAKPVNIPLVNNPVTEEADSRHVQLKTELVNLQYEGENSEESPSDGTKVDDTSNDIINVLPITLLVPHSRQPRRTFRPETIGGLARSIVQSGVVQPIVVRRKKESSESSQGIVRYEIIAGERRWRAAKAVGLEEVPVVVRELADDQAFELALIENIQREDLNAIDRATAYDRYCTEFSLKPEDVASKLGEDRTTVVNYLRLLELPKTVKEMVAEGLISMGHARCILGVNDSEEQIDLARRVVTNSLSVRVLEDIVRRQKEQRKQGACKSEEETKGQEKSPHISDLENRLQQAVGTKVAIKEGRRKGRGRIVIDYYSLDDFDRISNMLGLETE